MAENIALQGDKELIIKELTPDKLMRKTNYANNEIYVVTAFDSPNVMQEIGRLREVSFRNAGGGSGKALDIDEYDVAPNPYKQLVVWDPDKKEILGGYRYHVCDSSYVNEKGEINLATAELFNFSDKFIKDYLPHTIELGRSFVQPQYQSTSSSRKSIYALDNLWDGLTTLTVQNPDKKYFIGKVTMYPSYHRHSRDLLLWFMEICFGDKEGLIKPIEPIYPVLSREEAEKVFCGNTVRDNYKILSKIVRSMGVSIPPLISSYIGVSPTMKTFGTSINAPFGAVEETGIMITIADIYPEKLKRHLESFVRGIYFQ